MRRGLMAWDANEIPLEALQARIGRAQAAMAEAGEDALLVYTNFIRSAAVSWLTAFSPYWADGVLMVPGRGEPIFATTLSNRVATWVQSVKPIAELIHSPSPGAALAERLKDDPSVHRVGVVELDAFPGGLSEEFAAVAPNLQMVDGSASFAAARRSLDGAEAGLLAHAQDLAQAALDAVGVKQSVGAVVGAVEAHARAQGAEEAYVAIAPDLDADHRFRRLSGPRGLGRRFAVRATVAYKGAWIRNVRTYSTENAETFEAAQTWFADLAEKLDPSDALAPQIAASLTGLPGAKLADWTAESVVGTRPLAPIAAKSMQDARTAPWAVLTLRLTLEGRPWLGAALIGGRAA
jgi:hypothetical protein